MKRNILNLLVIGLLLLFAVNVKAEEVTVAIPAPQAGAKVYQTHSIGDCEDVCSYYEINWETDYANISEPTVYFDIETVYSGYLRMGTNANGSINYQACSASDTYTIAGASQVTCETSGSNEGNLHVVFNETGSTPIAETQIGTEIDISAPILMGVNGGVTFHVNGEHYSGVGQYRNEDSGITVKTGRDFEPYIVYSSSIDLTPDLGYTCFGLTGEDMEFPNIPAKYIESVEKDRNRCSVKVTFKPFYTIDTVVENGTVTVADKAVADESVSFTLEGDSAYELESLTIYNEDDMDITSDVLEGNVIHMPDYSIRIEAMFAMNGYSIVFHTNEGSAIADVNVTSDSGLTLGDILPENPTKEGYSFYNWYLDEEFATILDPTMAIDQNYDLYARWKIPFSMMCYDVTSGEPVPNAGGNLRFNDQEGLNPNAGGYMLNTDTYHYTAVPNSGYTFVGVTRGAVDSEIVSTNPNVTLTYNVADGGQYNFLFRQGVTVSFNTMGGAAMEPVLLAYNTTLPSVNDPVRQGFVFVGWYTNNSFTEEFNFNTPITTNTTIYAKWLEIVPVVDARITLPRGGANPDTHPVPVDDTKYVVSLDYWHSAEEADGYRHLNANDYFEAGKSYTVRLVFELREGYTYTNDTVFKINGEAVDRYGNDLQRQTTYATEAVVEVNAPVVVITKGDNNSLVLRWNNQTGAINHEVYRSTNKKSWSKVATVTDTAYTDGGLTYGKTYYYKVKSCTTFKCSGYSNLVSKKVVPNNVTSFGASSVGSNNIKLAWDKVNVTGYQIQRSTNNKKWSNLKTITKSGTLSFNNTKLSANKTYYYRIRAYKTVRRTKVYSGWTYVTLKTTPTAPSLGLSMRAYGEVNLKIGRVSGATNYVLERSLDGETYETLQNLSNSGMLTNTGLTTGTKYYYRVKACNGELCSPWASKNIISSTVTPGFSLKTSSKKVEITVDQVEGATEYEIYRATKKNGTYTKVATLSSDKVELSYVDSTPGVKYYFYNLLSYINNTIRGRYYYYKVRAVVTLPDSTVYSSYSGIKRIRSK